jgi:uncharacterized protein YukJ
MAIHNYGVVKGRVIRGVAEHGGHTPHYQVLVDANGDPFRVAVDTRAKGGAPELLFFADTEFEHPMLGWLTELEEGFHPLAPNPESGALDYVRGRLVTRERMRPIPTDRPGRDNDLNEKIGGLVERAEEDLDARVYAFGSRWGPEPHVQDAEFGFLPGNGVHDVHMNQGNPPGRHAHDNGAWQDGALLFHFPRQQEWIALFLAFQSQSWAGEGDPHAGPHPRHPGHHR